MYLPPPRVPGEGLYQIHGQSLNTHRGKHRSGDAQIKTCKCKCKLPEINSKRLKGAWNPTAACASDLPSVVFLVWRRSLGDTSIPWWLTSSLVCNILGWPRSTVEKGPQSNEILESRRRKRWKTNGEKMVDFWCRFFHGLVPIFFTVYADFSRFVRDINGEKKNISLLIIFFTVSFSRFAPSRYERENPWNRTISTVLWVRRKLPQSAVKLVLPSNKSYESKTGCNRTLATVLWVPLNFSATPTPHISRKNVPEIPL